MAFDRKMAGEGKMAGNRVMTGDRELASISDTDRNILTVLQAEGRISNVDLADRIGLSESPCFRRTRQLEESGVITGYSASLDQRLLGLQVTAFVQVSLGKQDEQATQQFISRVQQEAHIIECHAMSGAYDYLLKVVTRSMDHFSELTMQQILNFPGVQDIESHFSLKEIKLSRSLPLK